MSFKENIITDLEHYFGESEKPYLYETNDIDGTHYKEIDGKQYSMFIIAYHTLEEYWWKLIPFASIEDLQHILKIYPNCSFTIYDKKTLDYWVLTEEQLKNFLNEVSCLDSYKLNKKLEDFTFDELFEEVQKRHREGNY
jgi:hypothetical protein